MKHAKALLGLLLSVLVALATLNALATGFLYALRHPEKTRTEVLRHTPESFLWDLE